MTARDSDTLDRIEKATLRNSHELGVMARRYDRLEAQVGRIEEHLKTQNGTVADMLVEMGGAPGVGRDPERKSLRHRVTRLEEARQAALAVNNVLGLAFGRTAKFVVVGGALIAATNALLRLFGVGG